MVTRAEAQQAPLREYLEALGATVVAAPMIEIAPAADLTPLDRVLARLDDYQWLVLTSRNGAAALTNRLRTRSQRLPVTLQVAAVGASTAAALTAEGITVAVVPARARAEVLLEALTPKVRPGDRVLLVGAAGARPTLAEGLRSAGARVDVVAAYRTVGAVLEPEARESLTRLLAGGEMDAVTFASGSAIRALVGVVGVPALCGPQRPRFVCLGPVTAAEARALGLPVDRVAEAASMRSLADAVVRALSEVPPA